MRTEVEPLLHVTAFVSSYTTSGEILEIPEKPVINLCTTGAEIYDASSPPLSHLEVGRKVVPRFEGNYLRPRLKKDSIERCTVRALPSFSWRRRHRHDGF
jgi:hypothetical protein